LYTKCPPIATKSIVRKPLVRIFFNLDETGTFSKEKIVKNYHNSSFSLSPDPVDRGRYRPSFSIFDKYTGFMNKTFKNRFKLVKNSVEICPLCKRKDVLKSYHLIIQTFVLF